MNDNIFNNKTKQHLLIPIILFIISLILTNAIDKFFMPISIHSDNFDCFYGSYTYSIRPAIWVRCGE